MDEERRHQQHRSEAEAEGEGDDHKAAAAVMPVIVSLPPRLELPSENRVAGRK